MLAVCFGATRELDRSKRGFDIPEGRVSWWVLSLVLRLGAVGKGAGPINCCCGVRGRALTGAGPLFRSFKMQYFRSSGRIMCSGMPGGGPFRHSRALSSLGVRRW